MRSLNLRGGDERDQDAVVGERQVAVLLEAAVDLAHDGFSCRRISPRHAWNSSSVKASGSGRSSSQRFGIVRIT